VALAVLLLALNGPVHDLSDYYLFSIHMAQHLLLTLVFPPLLIAAFPGWLLAPLVRPPAVARMGRVLGMPIVAGTIFTVMLAVWHVVPMYDLMMRNHNVHVLTHILFMVTAVIMWWPVMSPLPESPRLTPGIGMFYLFAVSIPMQIVAAFITFADTVLYTWYEVAPRTFGLSALDDQRLGGLLMWIPGNLWIWGAMSVLFFQWAEREGDRR
jgi:putative membrane protein